MRTTLLACGLAVALALTGCSVSKDSGGSTDATKAADQQVVLGSMIWDTSVPFYSNFIKGQQDEAARLGAKLTIVDGKGDLGAQVNAVQQLISQDIDALLVTASDPKGIAGAVKNAAAKGIPVFAVNNRVDEGAEIITFIGADDYTFGQKQGELLVKTVGENAKVAYLLGKLGTSGQILRKQGFTDYLKNHPGITVVEELSGDWEPAKALAVVQDWLNKYPSGSLNAIVDQGPEGANAAKYAHERGRSDVKFVMGDYPLEVRNGIQAGTIAGTVNQDPKPQGVRSVQSAVDWVRGKRDGIKRPNDYLELPIVTKENVEQHPPAWGG